MTQYSINSDYRSLFGMDVHARTVSIRGIDLGSGETKTKRFNDCPSAEEMASWMKLNFPGPHYAAYESGCTGFHLCRSMREAGIDCDVVAVSTIARSLDDRKRKSDRKDARRLLSEMLNPDPSYNTVWTPDEECEGERDLVRARHDTVVALRRTKQQISALLLRHGHVYNEKTKSGRVKTTWTTNHLAWVRSRDLGSDGAKEALEHYLSALTEEQARLERLDEVILRHARKPRWWPYVDALSHIKGIDLFSAFLFAVEFGDFRRFPNGRSVSSWIGITPSSSASGDKLEANGHITKDGNPYCRTALIEALSTLAFRRCIPKEMRRESCTSEAVVRQCRECDIRIEKRYRKMVEGKKHHNVIKVALANELARWIWSIGCMVSEEQAA